MSTSTAAAFRAVKARLTGSGTGISLPLRWDGEEDGPLPDTPTAFAFLVFENDGAGPGPSAFGGGRGNNLYRSDAFLTAYVFVPQGQGREVALDYAETIAARMRSFRDADISCFAADVQPVIGDGARLAPAGLGKGNAVNDYQCVLVHMYLTFDQIG